MIIRERVSQRYFRVIPTIGALPFGRSCHKWSDMASPPLEMAENIWIRGEKTLLTGVTTRFITGRGPPCRSFVVRSFMIRSFVFFGLPNICLHIPIQMPPIQTNKVGFKNWMA